MLRARDSRASTLPRADCSRKIEYAVERRTAPTAEEVEQVYRDALDVARRQGAKKAAGCARRRASPAGSAVAAAPRRTLLAPIYATFTEGFDTRD